MAAVAPRQCRVGRRGLRLRTDALRRDLRGSGGGRATGLGVRSTGRHTALIHDYGSAEIGRQTGGWLTHKPEVIAGLEEIIAGLRQQAIPLKRYLART
jgi:hypothetical protein